uniref:Sushi domain-containing protein n=1 Tax=Gongylonema pulchrum TaxID=637853 RepID=A0A183EWB6_9BILA
LPPYSSGTTATLTCNIGSTPIGVTVSTCTNGVWNPPILGQCPLNVQNETIHGHSEAAATTTTSIILDCPSPPPIANGKV